MVKICPKCRKNKSYKKNNTKSSRKSKKQSKKQTRKQSKKQTRKQRGGKPIVYVAGIKNAGVDIPGQMAYLSK